MKEAVIVATARTGLTKSYRGSFNNLEAPSMVAPVIRALLERARVEPGEVEDVIMGAALQQGTQGSNIARQCAIAAGLPVSTAGMSVEWITVRDYIKESPWNPTVRTRTWNVPHSPTGQ